MIKYVEKFECNLPLEIPKYYDASLVSELKRVVDTVYARTRKLNAAWAFVQMDAPSDGGMNFGTFHALVAKVFRHYLEQNASAVFDAMSPRKVADLVEAFDTGENFPDLIDWSDTVDTFYDTAFVSTEDWELLRHFGIGGSDTGTIMGLSHFNSLEGLWHDKLGTPKRMDLDDGKNAIFDRGHFMESKVIQAFCDAKNAKVIPETRMFRSRKHPNATANLDAIVQLEDGSLAIFEAKTTVDAYSTTSNWYGSNVPSYYVTQTHHYMEVMDSPLLKKCFIGCIPTTDYELNGIYVGSVAGQKFFLHEIEYDAVYAGEIMQEEETFWSENIVKRRCPPPSHIGSLDNKVVLEYHKTPLTEKNVPEVTLSYEDAQTVLDSLVSLEDAYTTASNKLEKIKESRDAMRTEVRKLAMGATKVAFESKDKRKRVFITDCPTKGSARVDSKKLAEFFPEVYQKVVTQGTPTLRFKLTYTENTDPAQ